MNNETYVPFIDAHAESARREHDLFFTGFDKSAVFGVFHRFAAGEAAEVGVISCDGISLSAQRIIDAVQRVFVVKIHDPARSRVRVEEFFVREFFAAAICFARLVRRICFVRLVLLVRRICFARLRIR